ncbi:hypothetical protein [Dyadobacter pollutisoli]|jgi:hypothetical protein|uniref:Uncharacterized protein n=1 Tax=Dyadobacter pollutisoli TaxID=2910158 RepID=A0A9E8NAI5_9BACT|nr:hypothetical protein [Dyadobacter pollutisoli]WAC11481.1 hypothetical protein ON006_27590 [Dyadobacter pollutisoli]
MATENPKTAKEKSQKALQPTAVTSEQSTFDRKAEEMKAFLKRNPVPKEFLN